MIERTILLVGIILLLMTLITLFRKQQLKQAQLAASSELKPNDAKPQIVYFWSTQCSQCKIAQTPVIENLALILRKNTFSINKYNVSESPEMAKSWGVRTVPTTYVVDKEGNVQHVNNGLTSERILVEQIEGLDT